MNLRESSIEKIVRENTPDFFVGTSELCERFHSVSLFGCPVYFKKGLCVHKMCYTNEGSPFMKEYTMAYPDFVLMDEKQMKTLRESIYNMEHGIPVVNPFLRNSGWYCEVFGDFYHSEMIVGKSEQDHYDEVKRAYEESGNHVLILWECDIKNHWQEVCVPKINDFIKKFQNGNGIAIENSFLIDDQVKCLDDEQILFLNDSDFRKKLTLNEKDSIINKLSDFYSENVMPYYNRNIISIDWKNVIEKYGSAKQLSYSKDGNALLDYFIRSRFNAVLKDSRSINDIWHDKSLLRNSIRRCSDDSKKNLNSDVFLNDMINSCGYAVPKGMSMWHALMRMSDYVVKDGVFYDPNAEWGRRLVASHLCGMKYIGVEANQQLVDELRELAKYIGSSAEIYYGDSSDSEFVSHILNGRQIDLCFTSPCVYDNIKYFDDEFQFQTRYCSFDQWKNGFFYGMISNVMSHMTEHANFLISLPKDFELNSISGIDIKNVRFYGFNELEENPYFLIKRNAIEGTDYVRCEICGKCMNHLANHIQKVHGLSIDEYKSKYSENIMCENTYITRGNVNKTRYGNEKKKYNKRIVYLMPDGSYASKSDKYKRAWGVDEVRPEHVLPAPDNYAPDYAKREKFGVEGEDYVTCVECGFNGGNIARHLREKHNMTVEEYLAKHEGAPTKSRKVEEAFHNGSLKKWQTQFANGTSTPAVKNDRVENPKNRKRDDITRDDILNCFLKGIGTGEMAKIFGCSEVTMLKWIKELDVEVPSKTVLMIRRAVQEGFMDLEHTSLKDLENIIKSNGKERAMQMFGVKRAVFDTWHDKLKNKSISIGQNEPVDRACELNDDFHGQLPLFGEIETCGQKFDRYMKIFREMGFPYPSYTDNDALKAIGMVVGTKNLINEDGCIKQGGPAGNDWLLSFFPNFFECRHDRNPSARQMYDEKLEHIVWDIMQHDPDKEPTAGLLRAYLMEHERLTGFRPVVARQIYDRHCPENAAVLDPCGGWGGRMLGAYCSDKVVQYDCVEASRQTANGLVRLSNELDRLVIKKQSSVKFGAFEDVFVEYGKYDAVFTSTPYYRKEYYSDDPEQSCNRYVEYDAWIDGFLRPFVEKSKQCLKNGGKLIVNIDDVKIGNNIYPLKSDFVKLVESCGLRHVETMHMNYRNRYINMTHEEPIYVYIK